jgi:hypothetical protein
MAEELRQELRLAATEDPTRTVAAPEKAATPDVAAKSGEAAASDEAADSHSAAAPEIAAILSSPPAWLDGPREAGLAPLAYELQRGKMPRRERLAWRWECSVRPPALSPYAGEHYRVVVRIPLGYPAEPPKLSVLSVIRHLDIEVRDPHEGDLEDAFYEELARRAGLAEEEVEEAAVDGLRFGVGARVHCNVGVWYPGTVKKLNYIEEGWATSVPYQVRLGALSHLISSHPIPRAPRRVVATAVARGCAPVRR